MTATTLPTSDQPTRHQLAAIDRSARRKVTGRLKRALDAMVWDNNTDSEAAVIAKMNVLSIRNALQRPHVKAYYLAQREVLRARESARNIHTLINVRDQTSNQMARVQAVKTLEQISDDPIAQSARMTTPGIVIVLTAGAAHMAHDRETDAKPLIDHE